MTDAKEDEGTAMTDAKVDVYDDDAEPVNPGHWRADEPTTEAQDHADTEND